MKTKTARTKITKTETVPRYSLTIPRYVAEPLFAHLFPGDSDEHGAALMCGVAHERGHIRLLVRDVVLAEDGVDYVHGRRGYRMLTAAFITRQALRCRSEGLIYLAAHNHGGESSVGFSPDDLASQARGYPALLDIIGQPVGALVFARGAAAGRLWLSPSRQVPLAATVVLGPSIRRLHPEAPARSPSRPSTYDRQARLFGDHGQDILAGMRVGVIGAGGVGSLVVEYLARVGVGHFVIADPERLDVTNVPRVTGSTRWDARSILTAEERPRWLQELGRRIAVPKVDIMRRLVRRANPRATVEAIRGDIVDDAVARRFTSCDYLFLAADSAQARLVFNALVHQYLIPGVQMGAKVPVDLETGAVGAVYSVSRGVTPSLGCLWCNGLISPRRLQQEAETAAERRVQRYVDDSGVVAPSVITLNAEAASSAVNAFLFTVTGLSFDTVEDGYVRVLPRERRTIYESPRRDRECSECGASRLSRLARGDAVPLPTRR